MIIWLYDYDYSKIYRPSDDLLQSLDITTLSMDKSAKSGAANGGGEEKEDKEEVRMRNTHDKVLGRCVQRWDWTRLDEERSKRESEEADADRAAYQSIDW